MSQSSHDEESPSPGSEATDASTSGGDSGGAAKSPGKRRGFVRRHPVWTSLLTLVLIVVLGAAGFVWWANDQLGRIPRVDAGISAPPEGSPPEDQRPLNILVLGTDNGNAANSVQDDLADGKWTPGAHRSDTLMIVHVPADRQSLQVLSIPRDTWVKVPGVSSNGGYAKINAAFSYGGPERAVDTVEQTTGLRIDHVAMVDWDGFTNISSILGGVEVYIPESFESNGTSWERGWTTLEGRRALAYVRTRYNMPGDRDGDFGRIARQQNFMRATFAQTLSGSTLSNPIKLSRLIGSVKNFVVVDDTWETGAIRDLAWSMRDVRGGDITYATVPFGSYGTSADGQSYVVSDDRAAKLYRMFGDGRLVDYIRQYPEDSLGPAEQVY